jgi:hypothetical protein
VFFDLVCAAHWVRTVTYSHSAGKAEAELNAPTLRWLLRGEVFPDWPERARFAESQIQDRYADRSSSEDSIHQLFFGQFTLDKLFKQESRIGSGSEAL